MRVIVALALLLWACAAQAQPVISENFDSYSAGDVTCAAAPPGGVMSGSSWDYCYEDTTGGDFCDITVVSSITGFAGSFPSGNRVVRFNADTPTEQTECDLRIQGADTSAIPGDVWLHTAIYIRSAGTNFGSVIRAMKFWYPCRGTYPCSDNYWLPQLVRENANPDIGGAPVGFGADDLLITSRDNTTGTIDWDGAGVGDENKLGQTVDTDWIRADRWNTLTMHMDTSTSTCSFEAWIGEVGGALTKVMDWPGGQSVSGSLFNCTVTAGGHRYIAIPSTIPANNTFGMTLDMYLDDIVISSDVADLPTYAQPGYTPPSSPVRLRIRGADMGWLALGLIPLAWRRLRVPR